MIGIIVSLTMTAMIILIFLYNYWNYNPNSLAILFWLFFPVIIFGISISIRYSPSYTYERLIVTKVITDAKLKAFYKKYPEYERTFENNKKTIKEESVNNLEIEY